MQLSGTDLLVDLQCFHVFLALNALLVFAFYFFFKPLYIIMVFNWAFDSEFGVYFRL